VQRLIAGMICLVAGLLLIAGSFSRGFPVYDDDLPSDQIALFEEIDELQLVTDSTFSGVRLSGTTGRLITTYNRNQPGGRAACPT
jgi:hypothetical protein